MLRVAERPIRRVAVAGGHLLLGLGLALLAATGCTEDKAPDPSEAVTAAAATTSAPVESVPEETTPTAYGGVSDQSLPGPVAELPEADPDGVAPLASAPESGKVGSTFTLTGEGLPPDAEVQILWGTYTGAYAMNATPETVEFYERQFEPINVVLAESTTDSSGRLEVDLTVPSDYGEIHDIYAVVDGVQVAKGGFHVARDVTVSPTEGPVGTPITITATGVGWKPYESTLSVRYDNKYAGFMTATTTRGTAVAQIRASGPVGLHILEVDGASATVPYLNIEQSPVASIGAFDFTVDVTGDDGPPPASVEWPEAPEPGGGVGKTTITALGDGSATVTAVLSSSSGPILSDLEVKAEGLSSADPVRVAWVTAVGNRVSPSGWSLEESELGHATPTDDGVISLAFQVPDDLGGWHAVKLAQNGETLTEVPYFVERSLAEVTPTEVREGEPFTITIKGIGWTELDNGVAVTYDNAYIGYACGFNSQGDVTINLRATGGVGTHLIDLYPMIYQGHGTPPWAYQTPILRFKDDAPGLALGYRLPAFRLAIEIVA